MAESNPLLEAALEYARRGWHVLPLYEPDGDGRCTCDCTDCSSVGKHPRLRHGVKEASTNSALIEQWWRRWPGANVGVATGAVSGFVALDVDPRHGGDASLAEVEAKEGRLPETVEAITGGGGRHILVEYPPEGMRTRVGFMPGLDFRSDDALIVVEPSVHASGRRYAWEVSGHPDEVPMAPAPAFLIDLAGRPGANGSRPQQTGATSVIAEGSRNAALTSLAGTMQRRGMCKEALRAALRAENENRCRPPLSAGEVDRIAGSVSRYAPDPGSAASATIRIQVAGRQDSHLLHEARVALVTKFPGELFYKDHRLRSLRDHELVAIGRGELYERLATAAEWVKATKDGLRNMPLPKRLVDPLLESPGAPVPVVRSVIHVPAFVGEDFTFVSSPGYDEATQTLYVGEHFEMAAVPDEPTAADIDAAKQIIDEWLDEFPFSDMTARAHAIALLITLVVRGAISGQTAMFLIEAATPGTGKTLLAEVICLATHGVLPVSTQYASDGEEMGKRVASWVIAGRAVAFLDNLSRIGGDASHVLSSIITTGSIEVRAMRELHAAGGEWNGVIIATGNNVRLEDEMPRRICRIRLDSPEDPAARNFRRDDLHGWTMAHRVELVRAVAVLVSAWKAVGRPLGSNKRPSFIEWSQAVGGILGCADQSLAAAFLSTEDLADMMTFDDGSEDFRAFVHAWLKMPAGPQKRSTSELVKFAEDSEVLGGVLGDGNDRSRSSRMGRYLKKHRGKVVDGYRLDGAKDPGTKALKWHLLAIEVSK